MYVLEEIVIFDQNAQNTNFYQHSSTHIDDFEENRRETFNIVVNIWDKKLNLLKKPKITSNFFFSNSPTPMYDFEKNRRKTSEIIVEIWEKKY